MEMTEYEYSVAQKHEGKWRLYKWLMILLYVLFAVGYFVAIYVSRIFTLGALIPVFLGMLIFFTWKYVNPEYTYVISESFMIFYYVTGKKRKEKLRIKICEAEYIVPLEEALDEIQSFEPKRVTSAIPSASSVDSYIILYKNNKGERCAFMFKATSKALKCLKFYNSKTEITPTEI